MALSPLTPSTYCKKPDRSDRFGVAVETGSHSLDQTLQHFHNYLLIMWVILQANKRHITVGNWFGQGLRTDDISPVAVDCSHCCRCHKGKKEKASEEARARGRSVDVNREKFNIPLVGATLPLGQDGKVATLHYRMPTCTAKKSTWE